MSIIGILEGKFIGTQQCKNPEYFTASFNFPVEVYGNVLQIEDMDRPAITKILCNNKSQSHLHKLESGKHYKLRCSLGVSKPNTSSNGKTYPASLQIGILNVSA